VTAPFWTQTVDALHSTLATDGNGLSEDEAVARLVRFGPNADSPDPGRKPLRAIAKRLVEPLSLILLAAGLVSLATGDVIGGSIIVAILILSIGLDTVQEGHAVRAAELLRQSVALKARVRRDGAVVEVGVESLVPGDVIRVRAGDIVPADALILESMAFTANEAALTGEPFPVQKQAGR